MPFTDEQKNDYMNQIRAWLHAHVDGEVVFIEARHKQLNTDVLVGCIVRKIVIPPRVAGGMPTEGEQIIPIFHMVDPRGGNPYVSVDKDVVPIPEVGAIVLAGADPYEAIRRANEARED